METNDGGREIGPTCDYHVAIKLSFSLIDLRAHSLEDVLDYFLLPQNCPMTKSLTDSVVASLRPERGQTTWREIADGGCRGLCLRLSPRGERVWAVRHTVGGRRMRHTIGAYPAVTLAEARRRGGEYLSASRDGMRPEEVIARAEAMNMTVARAHRQYLDAIGSTLRERTRKQKATLFEHHINPVIGSRLLRTVRRADVIELVETIKKRFPVQANRGFSELMALLRWSEQRGYLSGVPTIRRKEVATRERPRRRTLEPAEIGAVWRASADLGQATRDFLRLLILTGQRRDEVRAMRWEEIDLSQGLWTIPSSRYKTGADHVVPLSTPALDLLRTRYSEGAMGFVLSGRDPKKLFNGAASAMRRLRKKLKGTAPFVLHDLRRTCRTRLSKLGVDDKTAELVIGHVPQGMEKVYDLHDRLDERRAALQRWGEFVLYAADNSRSVIPFPGAAAAASA
ncbi:MAG TPA: tyrosine-type recombinase/integrase [Stellaceae bacterium]|nr:tyrosine-type recombinase/integrase [Stellaceae bacterium]